MSQDDYQNGVGNSPKNRLLNLFSEEEKRLS